LVRCWLSSKAIEAQLGTDQNRETKPFSLRLLEQIPPGLNRGDSQSGLAEGVCRH